MVTRETDMMYSVKSGSPLNSRNVFAIQRYDQVRTSKVLDLHSSSASAPFKIVLPLRLACTSRMQPAVLYTESSECQQRQVTPAYASMAMILETKGGLIRKQNQATPQVLGCLFSTNGQQVSRHLTTSADNQRLLIYYISRHFLDGPYRGEDRFPGILESPSIEDNNTPHHTPTPVGLSFNDFKHASMETLVKNELTNALTARGLCRFLKDETVSFTSFSLKDLSITVLPRMDGIGKHHLRFRTKPLSLAADPFDVWLYQSLCCWMPRPTTRLLHQSLTTHNVKGRIQAWRQAGLSCLSVSLYACLHKGADLSKLGLVARDLDHGVLTPNGIGPLHQSTTFNAVADATDASESQSGRQERDNQGWTPAEEVISEQTTSSPHRKRRKVGPGKDDPPDDDHDDRSKKNDGGPAPPGQDKEEGPYPCPEWVYQFHYRGKLHYTTCPAQTYNSPAHAKEHVKEKHFKNLMCSNHLECQGSFTFNRRTRKLVHESSVIDCAGYPCGPEDAMMSGETMESIYKHSKGPWRDQWYTMYKLMHPNCPLPKHGQEPVLYLRTRLSRATLDELAPILGWFESDEGYSAEQKERFYHKLRNGVEPTLSSHQSQTSDYSGRSSTQYNPALEVQETTAEDIFEGNQGAGVHESAPDPSLASASATLLQDDISNSLPSIDNSSSTGRVLHGIQAQADPDAARLPMSLIGPMLNSAETILEGNQGVPDGFNDMSDVYNTLNLQHAHGEPYIFQGLDNNQEDLDFCQFVDFEPQDKPRLSGLDKSTNDLKKRIEDPEQYYGREGEAK